MSGGSCSLCSTDRTYQENMLKGAHYFNMSRNAVIDATAGCRPGIRAAVRSISKVAEAFGGDMPGRGEQSARADSPGVAEEAEGIYPKLIRFPGVEEALRVG